MPPSPSWPPRAASTCRCASTSRSCTPRAAPPAGGRWWGSSSSGPATRDAPGRKIYRCAELRHRHRRAGRARGAGRRDRPGQAGDRAAQLGARTSRTRPGRAVDPSLDAEDDLPPAPVGLTVATPSLDDDPAAPLGEAGGHHRRRRRRAGRADRVAAGRGARATPRPCCPSPARRRCATDVRQGLHYQQLRDRFPVLDGRDELVDELLDLYTSRNLYALQTIANKIDAEFRDPALAAVFRLALAACLLPGQPAERVSGPRGLAPHQRRPRPPAGVAPPARGERVAPLRDRGARRADRDGRAGPGPAPGALRRRPGRAGRHGRGQRALDPMPPGGGRASTCRRTASTWSSARPPPPASVDELSFEYLATAWLLGREAAETLRLEPLFGAAPARARGGRGDRHAARHGVGRRRAEAGRLVRASCSRGTSRIGCSPRRSPARPPTWSWWTSSIASRVRSGDGGGAPLPQAVGGGSAARRGRRPRPLQPRRGGWASHLPGAGGGDRPGGGRACCGAAASRPA